MSGLEVAAITRRDAGVAGLAELLRRERQILDDVAEVLERLPARAGSPTSRATTASSWPRTPG